MTNIVHLCDCMEYMRALPDKAFDLAIVDPPYGDGGAGDTWEKCRRGRFKSIFDRYHIAPSPKIQKTAGEDGTSDMRHWDYAPPPGYFDELLRISKNQIIWGGNYFDLPPTRCFVVWDKCRPENFSMAMSEYAWTSFNANAKLIKCAPQGTAADRRIHPTQKPTYLYKKLLQWYAHPGDRIFDSHVGSGSIRIACHDMGFDFTGCEIDKDYWQAQEDRFLEHVQQIDLFGSEEIQKGIYEGKCDDTGL